MSSSDSYAEYVLGLYAALLKDCEASYPALAKEFMRDYTRLSSAVEQNGIRFILDTMPAWRKHFDRCLSTGRLTRSGLLHFGSWKKGGTVPRLFRGLVLRVFDQNGELRPDVDVQAVSLIRQLLGVFRKLRLACGPKACSDAVRDFIRTDLEVEKGTLDWDSQHDPFTDAPIPVSFTDIVKGDTCSAQGDLFPRDEVSTLSFGHAECIQQVADYITAWLGVFSPTEWRFKHGPGAVSDQDFGSYKYEFKTWPDRLEEVFPAADFASANYASWSDSFLAKEPNAVTSKEVPARLIAVPKTIKVPRLIASEPVALQWCQQSIKSFLYARVAKSPIRSFIDFRRQEANGALALKASHDGSRCTIDLSSASDRVSCWHVERLFRRSPTVLRSLWATRSRWIEQDICRYTPRHYMLRKYSTMGNATTFPVQSLFFLAVALGTVLFVRNQKVADRSVKALGGDTVRVFGDDIIVPDDCARATVDALKALGLRVNPDKTFLTGLFRESCGVDAFAGVDVTTASVLDAPMRAKPGSVVSSVDVHNNLAIAGYYNAAAFIRKTVTRLGFSKILTVAHGSGSWGWYRTHDSVESTFKTRYNRDRFVRQAYVFRVKPKDYSQPASGPAALLQFFTEAAEVVTSAKSSLVHPLRRSKASLSLGWVDVVG